MKCDLTLVVHHGLAVQKLFVAETGTSAGWLQALFPDDKLLKLSYSDVLDWICSDTVTFFEHWVSHFQFGSCANPHLACSLEQGGGRNPSSCSSTSSLSLPARCLCRSREGEHSAK